MKDYLDPAAVAQLAGVSRETIHRYRVRGDIPEPDDYVGRTPVWREATIKAWLESRPGHGWRASRTDRQ